MRHLTRTSLVLALLVAVGVPVIAQVPSGSIPADVRARIESGDIPSNLPPEVRARLQSRIDGQQSDASSETSPEATGESAGDGMTERPVDDAAAAEDAGSATPGQGQTRVTGPASNLFGADVFLRHGASFSPVDIGPVDPDYRVGPGDEILIDAWGEVELHYKPIVNRSGEITLPIVGAIPVTGLTVEEVELRTRARLSRYHASLRSRSEGQASELSVTLGRLRPITVFVLGEVALPGAYTLSASATAFHALYRAGGITNRASLRRVCRYDAIGAADTLDVYDYLIDGDRGSDVRLRHLDVVFVPVIGRSVTIRGAVRRPGRYELRSTESLPSLLRFAGGFEASATPEFTQVRRVTGSARSLIDVDLRADLSFELRDGDVLEVSSALDAIVNTVSVTGEVLRPKRYSWTPGMTVASLIQLADGLTRDAFVKRADITRLNADGTTRVIPISLEVYAAGDSAGTLQLEPYDELLIRSIYDFMTTDTVRASGSVRGPGTFPYRQNMTVADLLFLAGGLNEFAYLPRADLVRHRQDGSTAVIPVGLERYAAGDTSGTIQLEPRDELVVRSASDFMTDEDIAVYGAVRTPGTYTYREGMNLADLLFVAGGIERSAYTREIQIFREFLNAGQAFTDTLSVSLPVGLDSASVLQWPEIPLVRRDRVFIRQRPDWDSPAMVEVAGEVEFPGIYQLTTRQERLVEVLRHAGGPTRHAYIDAVSLDRQGIGRVAVDYPAALEDPGSPENMVIQKQDRIFVPPRPATVSIRGAVSLETNVVHVPGKRVDYYLDLAGGVLDTADLKMARIQYFNGRTLPARYWLFWREVPPGATIIIPSKPPKPETDWGNTVRDTVTFLGSLATTVLLITQIMGN